MPFQRIDLTPALRPNLLPDETLLAVQDAVGLYEGRSKVPNRQNGCAYLTTHRVCYVDNEEPRKNSVAIELRAVDRAESYAGFLKSSPKITLYLRSKNLPLLASSDNNGSRDPSPIATPPRSSTPSNILRQWICPICTFSNPMPSNWTQGSPTPPCLTCGMKPPPATLLAAAQQPARVPSPASPGSFSAGHPSAHNPTTSLRTMAHSNAGAAGSRAQAAASGLSCVRCTFLNHPSLMNCEICGESLVSSEIAELNLQDVRGESPVGGGGEVISSEPVDSVKFSFRAGGVSTFHERLKNALVQRKWLQEQVPSSGSGTASSGMENFRIDGTSTSSTEPTETIVGIRGLERHGRKQRKQNELALAGAFEDLDALMSRAKEIIGLAEFFASQLANNPALANSDAAAALRNSSNALGITAFSVTKDHLSSSSKDSLYHMELAKSLADFLADDSRAILKREGGIMTLVDLWAVYNRARGIELISPTDLEKAAQLFEKLKLPVRLRKFKSGLLVVQEKSRSDESIIAAIVHWLEMEKDQRIQRLDDNETSSQRSWGRGVTATETAEKFGWSVGVANEELEMAEEKGKLCREVGIQGVKFWRNLMVEG